MESVLNFLGFIVFLGVIFWGVFLLEFRGLKKEREKWYSECVQAFAALMNIHGCSDFVARLKVDENRLKMAFCVYASFARVERMATMRDKLNELDVDSFNTLLDIGIFVEKGDVKSEEIKNMVSLVNDALIPFRNGETDDRDLFYKILVKSFMNTIGYVISLEPKFDDLYVVAIVDTITMGRVKDIKRND